MSPVTTPRSIATIAMLVIGAAAQAVGQEREPIPLAVPDSSSWPAEVIVAPPKADKQPRYLPELSGNQPRCLLAPGNVANHACDAQGLLSQYQAEASQDSDEPQSRVEPTSLPVNFKVWWDEHVQRGRSEASLRMAVEELVEGALRHSSYVKVVSTEPAIRETFVCEEAAAFDWRTFLDTTYNDFNDPVGNTLTTGNNENRLKDRTLIANAGLRRTNRLGGQVELSQQLGTQANNTRFLVPNPQATTRLELQYTQPLLNGAGRAVNESRIVLARIDVNLSEDKLLEQLQGHLLQVTEAYWEMYRARAEFFQRVRLLERAEHIERVLQGRQNVDSLQRQILRANAAVAARRSEIVRAQTSIRNAEARLRFLVNDPQLRAAGRIEFTPINAPRTERLSMPLADTISTALASRPDVSQAVRDIRAAGTELGVAKNQLLPKLDLVVSTYTAGLASQSNVASAFGKQLSDGRPGYSIGFTFELPVHNHAARARHRRRQLEMNRALAQFQLTVEGALTDVEIATREVDTTYREMVSRCHAVMAAEKEANYLLDRWQIVPGLDNAAPLLLEDLLSAQERLADEEGSLVRAQVSYSISVTELKREMGTLLQATSALASNNAPLPQTIDESVDSAEAMPEMRPQLPVPTSQLRRHPIATTR